MFPNVLPSGKHDGLLDIDGCHYAVELPVEG